MRPARPDGRRARGLGLRGAPPGFFPHGVVLVCVHAHIRRVFCEKVRFRFRKEQLAFPGRCPLPGADPDPRLLRSVTVQPPCAPGTVCRERGTQWVQPRPRGLPAGARQVPGSTAAASAPVRVRTQSVGRAPRDRAREGFLKELLPELGFGRTSRALP